MGLLGAAPLLSISDATAKVRSITTVTSSSGFNGKAVQTNSNDLQAGADYPFINALKTAQLWSYSSISKALDPSLFDSNGYPTSLPVGATNVFTTLAVPSQTERAGAWVLDWQGDGNCSINNTPGAVFALQILSVTQSGGIQTLTMASTPSPWLIAGMPIAISGISGGTWGGLSATWSIASVNGASNQITINTGTTYTGSPTVSGGAAATCVSTTTTSAGLNGSGRYIYVPAGTGIGGQAFTIQINSINSPTNYPGMNASMRLYHINDQSAINAGQVFSNIALQVYANFGVFRGLGWQQSNVSNVTTWSTRKPTTYWSYKAGQLRSDLQVGATTTSISSSGLTYNVTAPSIHSSTGAAWSSGGPNDKDTVQIIFGQNAYASITAAVSSGSSTILTISTGANDTTFVVGESIRVYNVTNGTGSGWTVLNATTTVSAVSGNQVTVPIDTSAATGTPAFASAPPGNIAHQFIFLSIAGSTAIPFVDDNTNPLAGSAGNFFGAGFFYSLCLAVYDAGMNVFITSGGNSNNTGGSLNNAIPPEIMFQFCVAIGAHPHWVMPVFASDPLTDWLPNLMAYHKANAPSWMIPRYEGPNELWNGANGFIQTNYAVKRQAIRNGCTYTGGNFVTTAFTCTAISWTGSGSSGTSTITVNGTLPPLGANISVSGTWTGAGGWVGQFNVYVTAVNVGAGTITVNSAPTSGTSPLTGLSGATITGNNGDSNNWYGRVMSTMGQTATAVYGVRPGAATNYYILCGVQTVNAVASAQSNARLESTQLVLAGDVQSPLTWSGGTITYSSVAAAPATGGSTATNYVSHVLCAQYWSTACYNTTSGTESETTLATNFSGAQFLVSSIVNGLMTVASVATGSASLAAGMTVFGANLGNIGSGITIASLGTGTGGAGTYQLSDATININYQQYYYAGVDMTAPVTFLNSGPDTVINGTITGNQLVVNSITSGDAINVGLNIYGGTIAFGSSVSISAMVNSTTFTLNSSPGNQTASFSIGRIFSLTGCAFLYQGWANWASLHNVVRMTGYEGGYSPDYIPGGDSASSVTAANLLRAASRWAPNMATYTKTNYDNFLGKGTVSFPVGFVAEFPSMFLATGGYPSGNVWQTLEDIYISQLSSSLQPGQWTESIAYH